MQIITWEIESASYPLRYRNATGISSLRDACCFLSCCPTLRYAYVGLLTVHIFNFIGVRSLRQLTVLVFISICVIRCPCFYFIGAHDLSSQPSAIRCPCFCFIGAIRCPCFYFYGCCSFHYFDFKVLFAVLVFIS